MKKADGLSDGLAIPHQERMGGGKHEVGAHACDLRAFNGNLAIIAARDENAVDPVDRTAAGNDAEAEMHGTQAAGKRAGAEFLSRRTVDRLEKTPAAQPVNHLTPLIGRAKHDDTSQAGQVMTGKVAPHQNASQGMGHKMDGRRSVLPALLKGRFNGNSA